MTKHEWYFCGAGKEGPNRIRNFQNQRHGLFHEWKCKKCDMRVETPSYLDGSLEEVFNKKATTCEEYLRECAVESIIEA